jgi:pimeloyl-ACP methyl ester carboxylesterase
MMMINVRRLVVLNVMLVTLSLSGAVPQAMAGDRIPDDSKSLPGGLTAAAGLTVEPLSATLTATQLASTLIGPGVTVSNAVFRGALLSSGRFAGGDGIIGFDSGILLTSGRVQNVVGPNTAMAITGQNGVAGDTQLTALAGYPTYDAAVLEFDFVPDGDQIFLQFVFASDEYNEFVGSQYNDVFAFYINGQNCALIENGPIAVNTINRGGTRFVWPPTHAELYLDNAATPAPYNTEMDGLTKILTCASPVLPQQVNHMKLAVADSGDDLLDAAVFLKAGSITTERRPVIVIPGMTASINYGCFFVGVSEWATCNDNKSWTWAPTAEGYYRPLLQRLEASGYSTATSYLQVYHYDWRQPLASNAARLKDLIDRVKTDTQRNEVDLIAHSMGGLVARALIQSDAYGDDVAHLVTLGSPHAGSAKTYPIWEGAEFYDMSAQEELVFNLVLLHYAVWQENPNRVGLIHENFPGLRDILPTTNYLLDDTSGDFLPESDMHERNTYLAGLNADLATLNARTRVATLGTTSHSTLDKYYVRPRPFWEFFSWVDGVPNWDRATQHPDDFRTDAGDGTVTLSSALLGGAQIQTFDGVLTGHGDLAANNAIINQVFTFLNISVASTPVDVIFPPVMAVYLAGPAQLSITDPGGQIASLGLNGVAGESATAIPGVEFISVPKAHVTLAIITDPDAGRFELMVTGTGAGDYALGLVDNFDGSQADPTFGGGWEASRSQIQPALSTTYALTYTAATSATVSLVAEQPVIDTPAWAGSIHLTGRAVAGSSVAIHDATTQAVLGTATADANGLFDVSVTPPLALDQRVFARAAGVSGLAVSARPHAVYLTLLRK